MRSAFSVWSGWDTVGGTRHTIWKNGAPVYLDAANTLYHPNFDPNTGIVFPAAESMKFTGYDRPASDLGAFMGTAWTTTANGVATLTLTNLAAGDYTIGVGGFCGRNGNIASGTTTGVCSSQGNGLAYKLSFTSVAAVPVPAGAWLFGPALAGLAGVVRRKGKCTL